MIRFGLVILVVAAACGGERRDSAGKERGSCRAGSACDPGLRCLSDVCVRPPAADCASVGETLASLDLGNYAEPEDRAPVVAKYKAACEQAHVTEDEGACLDKAKDRWSAGQCAARMFPELASTNSADCQQVVAKVDAAMKTSSQWSPTILRVLRESCEQDAWPDAMKQCVLMAKTDGGADAMQRCNQQMPPALQTKLQARLTAAIQPQ